MPHMEHKNGTINLRTTEDKKQEEKLYMVMDDTDAIGNPNIPELGEIDNNFFAKMADLKEKFMRP